MVSIERKEQRERGKEKLYCKKGHVRENVGKRREGEVKRSK